MSQPEADPSEPGEDQLLLGMRVERVTRSDGRYVLYFAWPGATDADEPDRSAPDPAAERGDV